MGLLVDQRPDVFELPFFLTSGAAASVYSPYMRRCRDGAGDGRRKIGAGEMAARKIAAKDRRGVAREFAIGEIATGEIATVDIAAGAIGTACGPRINGAHLVPLAPTQ